MEVRQILRVLARSRSLRFTINAARRVRAKTLAKLRWRGHDVFYRPGTSDPFVIYQVLLRRGGKAEYCLPLALEPKVILDIGSNIGTSILFFTNSFPPQKSTGLNYTPRRFAFCKRTWARFLRSRSIMLWARLTPRSRPRSTALILAALSRSLNP